MRNRPISKLKARLGGRAGLAWRQHPPTLSWIPRPPAWWETWRPCWCFQCLLKSPTTKQLNMCSAYSKRLNCDSHNPKQNKKVTQSLHCSRHTNEDASLKLNVVWLGATILDSYYHLYCYRSVIGGVSQTTQTSLTWGLDSVIGLVCRQLSKDCKRQIYNTTYLWVYAN